MKEHNKNFQYYHFGIHGVVIGVLTILESKWGIPHFISSSLLALCFFVQQDRYSTRLFMLGVFWILSICINWVPVIGFFVAPLIAIVVLFLNDESNCGWRVSKCFMFICYWIGAQLVV
jgi:hypothetical protein